jgi:hypothetical protein
MSPQETVEPAVNDATVIRGVLPRHSVKHVSRLLGVPIGTAHEWLYRRLSATRRRELADALLAEMDKQDVERSALRRRLAAWSKGED